MSKVLIVEDDDSMVAALRDGFEYEGYTVALARDGAAGLGLATTESFDLILLDVMLPKMSGLDVCREIRKAGNNVPIIMLTARGQEIDKVLGLKLGADDYVTKPFGFLELMARVEAVLRRASGRAVRVEAYQFGAVRADFKKGEVRKDGKMLELTSRELRLRRGHRTRPAPRCRVGLRRRPPDPHGGHARREATQEDRGQGGAAALPRDRPRHGIQIQRLIAGHRSRGLEKRRAS